MCQSKSHIRSQLWKKKTTCFLSPKTVYNEERKKTQEEPEEKKNKIFRAAKRTFPSTLQLISGLTEEAFSGHCYDSFPAWFIFCFFLFFFLHTQMFFVCFFKYALGFQPALPSSSEQYSERLLNVIVRGRRRKRKKRQKFHVVQKVCLFIQINSLDASTDTLTSFQSTQLKALTFLF